MISPDDRPKQLNEPLLLAVNLKALSFFSLSLPRDDAQEHISDEESYGEAHECMGVAKTEVKADQGYYCTLEIEAVDEQLIIRDYHQSGH